MFDHRIPRAPKPRYRLAAVLTLALAAASVLAYRHFNSKPSPARIAVPREEPARRLAILIFKSEKRMEVWGGISGALKLLRAWPILATSGGAGPKLLDGDRQIPEGVYGIAALNPNSRFHRSMKLDYPNAFDRKKAELDGRTKLGGDVCIHGKNGSIGCVAIADPAIEELYGWVENIGPKNVKIVIAPNDLRGHIPVRNPNLKIAWLDELYGIIAKELQPFARRADL